MPPSWAFEDKDVLLLRDPHPALCHQADISVRAERVDADEARELFQLVHRQVAERNQRAKECYAELVRQALLVRRHRAVSCPKCLAVIQRLESPGMSWRNL